MHELEARLSRWLLQSRDLLRSDTLSLTQEFLAQMLGVQRSSVTLVARRVRIPFSGGPGHTEEIIAKIFHATKKGRPLGRTAWTLLKTRSADVHDPFLSLRFGRGGWLSGKLKHCCCLTFRQVRQKLNVAIGKFQRVVVCARLAFVNLPKDSHGVLDCFHFTAKQANPRAL
jgi:hypothetical protein